MPAGIDRLAGFRSALADAGMVPVAVEDGNFTADGGSAAMGRILESGASFDALFVGSDLMARGALAVLARAGIDVPGDVSLIGFDDSPVATAVQPNLTTVRQPSHLQGQQMADVLLSLLAGGTPPHVTMLPTELIVRGSA